MSAAKTHHGNRPSQLKKRYLQLENLEARSMMAANVLATLDTAVRTLNIEGTESKDKIVVFHVGNEISVQANGKDLRIQVTHGAKTTRVNSLTIAELDRVEVNALGGNDSFILRDENRQSRAIVVKVDGGAGNDKLQGGAGNDELLGGAGQDTLIGHSGHDTLRGGDHDDLLQGEEGDDTLEGGEGNDHLTGAGGNDMLSGGIGNDLLEAGFDPLIVSTPEALWTMYEARVATLTTFEEIDQAFLETLAAIDAIDERGADRVMGGDGDDIVWGGGGADILDGGTGDDTVYGEAGIDSLVGGDGNDWLYGGNNSDTFYDGAGNDVAYGQEGDDWFFGDDGDDRLFGDIGTDNLYGGNGFDYLWGGDGNDRLAGEQGDDVLFGEAGDDTLLGAYNGWAGEPGNDTLYGGDGNDTLWGGDGNDTLVGEGHNDRLEGENGNDILNAGDGDDSLNGGAGTDQYYGDAGYDTILEGGIYSGELFENVLAVYGTEGATHQRLNAIEQVVLYGVASGLGGAYLTNRSFAGGVTLVGTEGSDYLTGGAGNDVIYGHGGNDTLTGGGGNDYLHGHGGHDKLFGGDGDDLLNGGDGWDELRGGNDDDRLIGENGADKLFGEWGNDTLIGPFDGWAGETEGNDEMYGGEGHDTLYGGDGDDRMYGESGNDTLYGESGMDSLNGGSGFDILQGGAGYDKADVDHAWEAAEVENVRIVGDFDWYRNDPQAARSGLDAAQRLLSYWGTSSYTLRDPSGGYSHLGRKALESVGISASPSQLRDALKDVRYGVQLYDQETSYDFLLSTVASGRPAIALISSIKSSTGLEYVLVVGANKSLGYLEVMNNLGERFWFSRGQFEAKWNWYADGWTGDYLTGIMGVKNRTMIFYAG